MSRRAVVLAFALLLLATVVPVRVAGGQEPPATPQDNPPPDVALLSPESGTVLAATVPLSASTVAETAVVRVAYLVDGAEVAAVTEPPWDAELDTTTLTEGDHTVEAVATVAAGGDGRSGPVPVVVDQAAASGERLAADFAAGVITPEEHARFGVYRLFDPSRVPATYRPPEGAPVPDRTWSALRALDGFGGLDPAVRDELAGYLSVTPASDPPGTARTSASAGYAGFVDCVDPVRPLVQVLEEPLSCQHPVPVEDASGTVGVRMVVNYDVAEWNAAHGVAPTDALGADLDPLSGGNGVPDYVDEVAASLRGAWETYVAYGYLEPEGTVDVSLLELGESGMSVPRFDVFVDRDRDEPAYLPRHELFHQFQYRYGGFGDVFRNYAFESGDLTVGWWLEATAEWAAHQAGEEAREDVGGPLEGESSVAYADNLPTFLGEPSRPMTEFYSPFVNKACAAVPLLGCARTGGPQYGAFIFTEHLEERLGRDVIRESWERYAENTDVVGQPMIAAVRDAVVDRPGRPRFTEVVRDYHRDTYRMDYADPDRDLWVSVLANPNGPTQAAEPSKSRPARTKVRPDGQDRTVASLGQGGVHYADIDLDHNVEGVLRVLIDTSDHLGAAEDLYAEVTVWGDYPTECASPTSVRFSDPTGRSRSVDVPVPAGCTFGTLMVSHTDPTVPTGGAVRYSAEFAAAEVRSGGSTWAVSQGPDGTSNYSTFGEDPVLSGDGGRVVWHGDAKGVDPYVSGRTAWTRTLPPGPVGSLTVPDPPPTRTWAVNVGPVGVSADGGRVLLDGEASVALAHDGADRSGDLLLRDTPAGRTHLVSRNTAGDRADVRGSLFNGAALSADGTAVVFAAEASNVDPDGADTGYDPLAVYARLLGDDIDSGTTVKVSTDRTVPYGGLGEVDVSASGRTVVWESDDSRVWLRDLDPTGVPSSDPVPVSALPDGTPVDGGVPQVSDDGTVVAFTSSHDTSSAGGGLDPLRHDGDEADVFVWERQPGAGTGTTTLATRAPSGTATTGVRFRSPPALSGDGSTVAFVSAASDLAAGDTNGVADVFTVRWDEPAFPVPVSVTTGGVWGDGPSDDPSVSGDGSTVAFRTTAPNLGGPAIVVRDGGA